MIPSVVSYWNFASIAEYVNESDGALDVIQELSGLTAEDWSPAVWDVLLMLVGALLCCEIASDTYDPGGGCGGTCVHGWTIAWGVAIVCQRTLLDKCRCGLSERVQFMLLDKCMLS